MRNDPITIIVVNNTIYAMTGGQLAPTTLIDEKTTTTPEGRDEKKSGRSFLGPEMVAAIAAPDSYIARGIVSQPDQLKTYLEKALRNQLEKKGISFVEVLSTCPTNWKTNARESLRFLEAKMAKFYNVGELSPAIHIGENNET
jgi:2-oxoglutarate ferredoxin oxidoreductase subunit beta